MDASAAVLLAAIGSAQIVLLAWIAAWQARAAHEVRKINGHVERALAANEATLVKVAERLDESQLTLPFERTP